MARFQAIGAPTAASRAAARLSSRINARPSRPRLLRHRCLDAPLRHLRCLRIFRLPPSPMLPPSLVLSVRFQLELSCRSHAASLRLAPLRPPSRRRRRSAGGYHLAFFSRSSSVPSTSVLPLHRQLPMELRLRRRRRQSRSDQPSSSTPSRMTDSAPRRRSDCPISANGHRLAPATRCSRTSMLCASTCSLWLQCSRQRQPEQPQPLSFSLHIQTQVARAA